MSLQHVWRVVEHLRSRGYQSPFRELTLATLGGEIYFQHPDGMWDGDLRPDQVVLEEVLRLMGVDRLRSRITRAAERQADDEGQVLKKRGVHASAPVDAAAGRMLRRKKHDCLTASQVELAAAADGALTVWARGSFAIVGASRRSVDVPQNRSRAMTLL
jgi:hypothetical protein